MKRTATIVITVEDDAVDLKASFDLAVGVEGEETSLCEHLVCIAMKAMTEACA